MNQGWLAVSTECERRKQPFHDLAPTARIGRHQLLAPLAQMKQDRAALEDRDVSIGQPRHLAERLVREMRRLPIAKWRALDAIGQSGLFQRPTHPYVTHIAARHTREPNRRW